MSSYKRIPPCRTISVYWLTNPVVGRQRAEPASPLSWVSLARDGGRRGHPCTVGAWRLVGWTAVGKHGGWEHHGNTLNLESAGCCLHSKLPLLVITAVVIHHSLRSNASALGLRDPGHGPTPHWEVKCWRTGTNGTQTRKTHGAKLPAESVLSSIWWYASPKHSDIVAKLLHPTPTKFFRTLDVPWRSGSDLLLLLCYIYLPYMLTPQLDPARLGWFLWSLQTHLILQVCRSTSAELCTLRHARVVIVLQTKSDFRLGLICREWSYQNAEIHFSHSRYVRSQVNCTKKKVSYG